MAQTTIKTPDTCRHLPTRCAGGLCAIAPDLYARQGDAKGYKEIAKLMSEVVSKVPDAQVMADLDAAVQWAGKNGGNTKKVADTGFCCGGRIQRTHTQAPSRFCCELERPGVGLVRRRRRRHCAHHGQPTEFVVYRTAPHAFHADYRPSYLNEDAADGFKHAMARFKAHGVA